MAWITLIIGAILGGILSYYIPIMITKVESLITEKKRLNRKRLLESGTIHDWIINYYKANGHLSDLYDCKIGKYEVKIPFLTVPEWSSVIIDISKDDNVEFSETEVPNFPIDKKMISSRKRLGQNLFNDDTLYLDRVEKKNELLRFHVKKCSYFEMFTLLSSVEEETFRAIKSKSEETPVRDKMFPNVKEALKLQLNPNSIGCQVLLAFKTKTSYDFLIQTRSHSIVTFGGAKATIPCYGLSPIPSTKEPSNLLLYNFIKEYCEELYDLEELIKISEDKNFNPYWFYELPQSKRLIDGIKNGNVMYKFLGFGFDGLNGSATIATIAIIDDIDFLEKIKKEIKSNWEVAKRKNDIEPLEFVDYKSDKLENWLRNRQYHYGSAYTISLAIRHLNENN